MTNSPFRFAALIPLVEAEQPGTQRQYSLKYDEDVDAVFKEATSTKKVIPFALYYQTQI